MELRIAGAQIPVFEDLNRNFNAVTRAVRYAAENKADILLTPEGSLSGYHNRFSQADTEKAIDEIVGMASDKGLGLALGTCFYEADGKCYDQLRFYDPKGVFLGYHAKILLCGPVTEASGGETGTFTPGILKTFQFKGITIGGLVCNDLWANPTCTLTPDVHLSQQLSRMGARVVFHAVSGWRDGSVFCRHQKNYHESNLVLRALAGKLWIVTADNAEPENVPVSSPGGIVSPDGEWLVRAGDMGEQFFCHSIVL